MNIADWILLALIVCAAAGALVHMRRKGRGGACCGDCSKCGQDRHKC